MYTKADTYTDAHTNTLNRFLPNAVNKQHNSWIMLEFFSLFVHFSPLLNNITTLRIENCPFKCFWHLMNLIGNFNRSASKHFRMKYLTLKNILTEHTESSHFRVASRDHIVIELYRDRTEAKVHQTEPFHCSIWKMSTVVDASTYFFLSLSHHLSFSPMSMLSPHTSITVQKWFKHLSYQMSSRYFAPQSERKTRNENCVGITL